MTYLRFLFVVCFLISTCFFGPDQEQEQRHESDTDLDAVRTLTREEGHCLLRALSCLWRGDFTLVNYRSIDCCQLFLSLILNGKNRGISSSNRRRVFGGAHERTENTLRTGLGSLSLYCSTLGNMISGVN